MAGNRASAIFEQLYDEVFHLVDWLHQFTDNKSFAGQLLLETDSKSYRNLLETTVIGISSSVKPLSAGISFSQVSHQQEIILRVIERLFKRKGAAVKNVLTLGFGPMSDDPDAHISSAASIESYYPNNNVSRLQYSSWKKLLTRVGDDVMSYLLENTAIFMFLPPSCYIQLAGIPVYELWSFKPGKSIKHLDPKVHKPTVTGKRHQRYWQTFSETKKEKKRKKQESWNERLRDGQRISRDDIVRQCPANLCNAESVEHVPEYDHFHSSALASDQSHYMQKHLINEAEIMPPRGIKRNFLIETENVDPKIKCLRLDEDEAKGKWLKLNDFRPEEKCLNLEVKQKVKHLELNTGVDYTEVQQCVLTQTKQHWLVTSTGSEPLSESSQYEAVPIGRLEQNSQIIKFVPLSMQTPDIAHLRDDMEDDIVEQNVSQNLDDESYAIDSASRNFTGMKKLVEGNGGIGVVESSMHHPTKKRRRRRKKANKCQEEKDYKPYDFHKYFARMNLLYTKNLRESLGKSFCLNKFDASQLLDTIFIEPSVQITSCSNKCDKQSNLVTHHSTNQKSCLVARQIVNAVNCERTILNDGCENETANYQIDCDLNGMENSLDSSGKPRSQNSTDSSFTTYHRVCNPPKSSPFTTKLSVCNPPKSSFATEQRVFSSSKSSSCTTEHRVCNPSRSSLFTTEQIICIPPMSSNTVFSSGDQSNHSIYKLSWPSKSSMSSGSRSEKDPLLLNSVSQSDTHASSLTMSSVIGVDKSNSCTSHVSSDYEISEFTSSSERKEQDSPAVVCKSFCPQRTSEPDHSASSGSEKSKDLFVDSLNTSSDTDTRRDGKQVFPGLVNKSPGCDITSGPDNLVSSASKRSKEIFFDSINTSSDSEKVLAGKVMDKQESSFEDDILHHDKQKVSPTLNNKSPICARMAGQDHSSFYGSENSKDILLNAISNISDNMRYDKHIVLPALDKSSGCERLSKQDHSSFYGSENSKDILLNLVAVVTEKEACLKVKSSVVGNLRSTCDRSNSFHEHILPLLQRMLSNHRKCPYRHLLNHYCPVESVRKKKKPRSQSFRTETSVQTVGNSCRTSSSQSTLGPACSSQSIPVPTCSTKHVDHLCPDLSAPVVTRGQPDNTNIKEHITLRLLKSQKIKNKKPKMSTGKLLETFSTSLQVFCLFRAIVLQVVPIELFGSKNNRNIFFKNLKTFICLGKFDKFCLGQVMTGIKVTSCKWLRTVVGQSVKVKKMAQIVWWLFNDFIMALLKAFFYITDTTTYRNRLFYYRKRIWHLLHMRALQDLVQKKMLQTVSETRVTELMKTESSLGISYLRFLPKSGSLRPIINMGRRPVCGSKKTLSINQQLMKLLHVLKFHVKTNPTIVGSSLFGIDDIYQAWLKYIEKRSLKQDGRSLYFVKTDISDCFDSIRQEKLYDIVCEILNKNTQEEYVTRRFASVVMAGGRLKRTFHRDSNTLFTYQPDFFAFTKRRMSADNLRNIILVDQVVNHHDTVNSLLKILKAHLFNNIIKVGRRFYLQHTGISQGSVLSTMLCNLYYGHMERQTLDIADEELLLRMVDDFLYVTPYKTRAEKFLDDMLKGNHEYNCKTNINKVLTNFTVNNCKRGNIPNIKPSEPLPWCGLLLNTQTLEVSVDYSRYAGLSISDTMTFDLAHHPGLAMKNKLTQSLRPKCHGIFFDSQINSEEMVIINVYKLMMLTAHKFHAYMMHLPPSRRSSSNVQFFQDMILTLSTHLYYQSTDKMCHPEGEDNKKVFPFSLDTVKWLTLEAFLSKLKKHHSVYSKLIKALQDVKRGLYKRLTHTKRLTLHTLTTSEAILDFNPIVLKT